MSVIVKFIIYFFDTLQIILALYVMVPVAGLFVYLFRRRNDNYVPTLSKVFLTKDFEFAIIVTVHQDTDFIAPIVDSIQKQTYKNFHVYIVADDCDVSNIQINQKNVSILQPPTALHSKIKSIQHALSSINNNADALIILDADNLIHPNFLGVINGYFQKGYKVVQAGFKPKNTSTVYARMDAIGDLYNFFTEREMRMLMGLSSTIWGAGIAIDMELYKEVKYTDYLGGFDKKLQAHLVQRVERIAYAPEAILYDEKISSGKSLENQRTRWISSYFKYFKDSWSILRSGLKKFNFNLIYFGFHTLRPPLFIILGFALITTLIDLYFDIRFYHSWLFLLGAFFLSFALIVIIKGQDIKYLKTMLLLPFFVARQVMALLKLKKAKHSFLKTQNHNVIYISDLLRAEIK